MLQQLFRYVPAFESLREYSWHFFLRDLFAGATVAAVAVPQAIAYAMIFNMPAEYGLYTAIVMTIVGSLLASSRQLINGPTNAISIAMLSALAVVPQQEKWISAAILMACMIGIIQTSIALLRLGDLSRFISHAVVVGFTAGASVLLILDQFKNAVGLSAQGDPHDHFLTRFWLTLTQGGSIHLATTAVAMGTVAVVLFLRWINRRTKMFFPDLLIAIVLAGVVVWWLDLGNHGVKLVSKIPTKLPPFGLPVWDWELIRNLSGSATAVALLGLLEAVAMSKSLAARTHQKLDINQQCLSEGIANLAGSFFNCFPGSGSLTRSHINYQAGAATQWSGVICALLVALTVVCLAPLAQFIPRAALAGVLLLTALRMVDVPSLMYQIRATRFDAIIVIATALAAVLISVEYCILIGVFLSFLFYVPRAAHVSMTELIVTADRHIRDRLPHDPICPLLRIYNFEGELFFGSSPDFENLLDQIESQVLGPAPSGKFSVQSNVETPSSASNPTVVVLLRLKHVRNLDAVCLQKLGDFLTQLTNAKVQVALTGVRDDVYAVLENVGIVEQLGKERVFREVKELWSATMSAVGWAYQQIGSNRCADCPHDASFTEKETRMYFVD